MSKINNRNTRTRCEICLMLTIKTAERRHLPAGIPPAVNLEPSQTTDAAVFQKQMTVFHC